MIHALALRGFKNIESEDFCLKPITIYTGLNSTGKSTVLQSILLLNKELTWNGPRFLNSVSSAFSVLRNIYINAKEITVSCRTDKGEVTYRLWEEGKSVQPDPYAGILPEFEKNLFYLSANRVGVENDASLSVDQICGLDGRFLYGTYEQEKSRALDISLVRCRESLTLAAQVNYWLAYILGVDMQMTTEKRNEEKVEVRFRSDGIPNLLPTQLGAGVSYLAKILILCLRAKKGDVLMIENPEIHLHPAAQSKLGEFFAFIASAGIQLIIETHCEHLLNRLRYEVYRDAITPDDLIIYYKGGITDPFQPIHVMKNGKYDVDFPTGFFDATLTELLEME